MFEGLKTTRRSALAVLLCSAVAMSTLGCTPQQQADSKAVMQKFVSYEPEVASATDLIASVVKTLAPADAALITAGQATFDGALAELTVAANAYIATPNAGTLASVSSVLQTLLTTNANQFLAAAHISDPASVAIAKTAIAGVRVVLLLMDSLLAQLLPAATVTANNAAQPIHLRDIKPYIDQDSRERVVAATGVPYWVAFEFGEAHGL